MTDKRSFFAELKRRNVLRAGALYIAAAWALAQGAAQLLPVYDVAAWVMRWIIAALIIGFPFWLVFAWFYEFTPQGMKRESDIAPDDSTARSTGRKLDKAIIAVLAIAVVLLLTNTFVWHKGAGLQPSAANAVATPIKIPQKSVAVLPFVNESGDKDQQYFSDGLSEDLITALSQFAGLKVISRDSAFRFRNSSDDSKTIGEKLGVAHLLEGTVQRSGDQIRISAELVNAADGTTLWSEHYDRPYKDLFALQDAITKAVADALKAKLLATIGAVAQSNRPPGGNLAAYNDYLRGHALGGNGSDQDLRKSIQYYDDAIRIDPGYAQAYAMKSGAWTALARDIGGAQAQDAYAHAQTAADTALSLDQNLVTGHLARGFLLYTRDFDWSGAVAEFERALQLAPNDARAMALLGQALASLGQTRRAIELTREALLNDPLNAVFYANLFSYYLGEGRLDDAERAVRTQMTLQKSNDVLYGTLSNIEIQRGNAKAALQDAQRVSPGPWHAISMAMALQIGDDRAAADAALKTVIAKYASGGPYQIAEVYALRKDPDNMFKWLDRAWAAHDAGIGALLYDPFILRYKDDPRFAAFCRKVGLPVPGKAPVAGTAVPP
ncbi:MAG: tetratricopeptide repeat protein [Gammaproteobacteria bacterium]